MIIGPNNDEPRAVHGLTDEQRNAIANYLQGLVYGWCESMGTKPFFAHDLVGGDNWDWKGTPLQYVYAKQGDSPSAYEVAGRQVGYLLKRVIYDDGRGFTCEKAGRNANRYAWDGKSTPKPQRAI